jgi:hypothetical protein
MWSKGMPLMAYRDSLFKKTKDSVNEFKKWASMGPFYKEYGLYIIRRYPLHFLAFFAGPNARKYYAPPIEFLESYNSGKNYVTKQAQTWFGYKSLIVKTRMKYLTTWVLDFYPILTGIINLVMLFGLIYYMLLKGWKHNLIFMKAIIMGASVWLLNAGFTILASSAALRFQSFPILLTTAFAMLLVDWMAQLMRTMKSEQAVEKKMKVQVSNNSIA